MIRRAVLCLLVHVRHLKNVCQITQKDSKHEGISVWNKEAGCSNSALLDCSLELKKQSIGNEFYTGYCTNISTLPALSVRWVLSFAPILQVKILRISMIFPSPHS